MRLFPLSFRSLAPLFLGVLLYAWTVPVAPSFGQQAQATRFVSLGSSEINVRVGPGQRYDIAWVFVQRGLPVEVIQEYDNWRKIRDAEGNEGWIHRNLLSSNRTALISPWLAPGADAIPVRARPEDTAPLRVRAAPRVLVAVQQCDTSWCAISGSYQPDGSGGARNFSGYVAQEMLWGVYADEAFD